MEKGESTVVACLVFFVAHWQGSLFFQSFFLHRYGAHGQFTLSRTWERVFHALTWVVQGPSYLHPRAYAILHRWHHAYSDTPRDPHSPTNHHGPWGMMVNTARIYNGLRERKILVDRRFEGGYPEWPLLDRTLYGTGPAVAWTALYLLFYLHFATSPWLFLLVPVHVFVGPIQGAIVNWCGHRYGYRNFNTHDDSRNTVPVDLITGGELMQNNHHAASQRPNFAARRFELDTTWQVIRLLAALRIVKLRTAVVVERPSERHPGR
jgi:stearoyl-CoA desaturase (delta-9 desaturase)